MHQQHSLSAILNLDSHPASSVAPQHSGAIEAIYAIGHMLVGEQRIAVAVKVFRVMVRLVPTDERAWLGLGACHEHMDEDDVAAELYGAGAVAARPPSARCLVALSQLKRRTGEAAVADECLAEAIEIAAETGDDLGVPSPIARRR